eukprot:TRINITY_DN15251_c0_g1_i2.p1 TRINITY_DN15251_c0_g1~~TRINITY_DN15251_c0_g1_i2.p1  ORF type:complete len:349 (-),score=41.54 TRINITY_DN15251_c0_g1_i2:600-1601(-)
MSQHGNTIHVNPVCQRLNRGSASVKHITSDLLLKLENKKKRTESLLSPDPTNLKKRTESPFSPDPINLKKRKIVSLDQLKPRSHLPIIEECPGRTSTTLPHSIVLDEMYSSDVSQSISSAGDRSSSDSEEPERVVPWAFRNYCGEWGAHNEVEDFCFYITPTPVEHHMRKVLIDQIHGLVKEMWPNVELRIYGSYTTGLYLPTSDIDCVITGKLESPACLYRLSNKLAEVGAARPENIQVLATTKVPLVKYIDSKTGCQVDISFNQQTGPKTSSAVWNFLQQYGWELKALSLVIKYFLQQKGLNGTYSGGLGSYTMILMVVSFLQVKYFLLEK